MWDQLGTCQFSKGAGGGGRAMKCYGPKINFEPSEDWLFWMTIRQGKSFISFNKLRRTTRTKLQVKVRVAKFYLLFLTTCNVFCGVSFLKTY